MNRPFSRFSVATLTLTLTLGLGACSGDDSATTASTTNSSATTTTSPGSTTDPTAATESTGTTDDPSATDTDPTTTADPSATDTDPSATDTDPSTTDPSTTDPSTTDPSTTDPTEDPTGGVDTKWPPLNPMNPMMPCPEGYAAASFVMGGAVCAPKCTGVGKICPSGDTGTAKGACAFNPESSGDMCMMGDKCADETEMCQQTGGGGYACLAPTSHCVLLCNGGESCPDGMKCFGNLVCQYPL